MITVPTPQGQFIVYHRDEVPQLGITGDHSRGGPWFCVPVDEAFDARDRWAYLVCGEESQQLAIFDALGNGGVELDEADKLARAITREKGTPYPSVSNRRYETLMAIARRYPLTIDEIPEHSRKGVICAHLP